MGLSKKQRYRYLVDARNFHYESFNKWMTYFYVALGTLFVAYYSLLNGGNNETEKLIVLILGYCTSLFWYWSSKGYYFWNVNFITLINHHELKVMKLKPNERVYSVFANKKVQNSGLSPVSGANISTSKVAILFAFVVSIVWGYLLLETLIKTYCYGNNISIVCIAVVSVASTIGITSVLPVYLLKSKFNHLVDLEIDQDKGNEIQK